MIKYIFKLSASLLFFLFFFPSCQSSKTETLDGINEEFNLQDDYYLKRPKFILDSPVATLPYRLRWNALISAKSFELQSAENEDFTKSRKTVTTKENSIVINEMSTPVKYYRSKALFEQGSSPWSEVMKISMTDEGLNLKMQRK